MEATDDVLVRRLARQGDHEAFSTLASRYADMVYSTCLRILRNDSQAADVTQETFFQMFKNAARITGSPGGWLHQVATRHAIDLVRQNVSRRRREDAYAREQDGPESSWAEVAPLVDAALERLPEEHRDLLVQHFLERKTMCQIAAAKGISQPTVSRRVAEGLEWVRQRLRHQGVTIGVVPLQSLLLNTAEVAPELVLRALGKVALASAATAPVAGAGVSWFGGTGAIALVGTAAVVAVAFNLWLPAPEWAPTAPLPGKPSARAATANSAPAATRPPPAAVIAEAPQPSAQLAIGGTSAQAQGPRSFVWEPLHPAATNAPPATPTPAPDEDTALPTTTFPTAGTTPLATPFSQFPERYWQPSPLVRDPQFYSGVGANHYIDLNRVRTNPYTYIRDWPQNRPFQRTVVLGPGAQSGVKDPASRKRTGRSP